MPCELNFISIEETKNYINDMDFVLDLRVKNYIVVLVAQSMPVGSGVFDAFFLEISREQLLYQCLPFHFIFQRKLSCLLRIICVKST